MLTGGSQQQCRQRPTLPGPWDQVPSALEGLTTVFGMGTGITPPLSPPANSRQVVFRRPRHAELNRSSSVRPAQASKIIGQASRQISTARLNASLRLHLQPINVLVSDVPSGSLCCGRSSLGVGFALRCFQRLSSPHVATQRCPWQDNWYTRGAARSSPPVPADETAE